MQYCECNLVYLIHSIYVPFCVRVVPSSFHNFSSLCSIGGFHVTQVSLIITQVKNKIDHFSVVCSVTWPLNGSEVKGGLVLIQTSLLLLCKSSCFNANYHRCIYARKAKRSVPVLGLD